MKIFPAIDIKDGRVVRLKYGDYQQMSVYDMAPSDALAAFSDAGATCVHVVDLDGAKDGHPGNAAVIEPLLKESKLFAEIGGGIRDMATIDRYLAAGAGRVILGTAALADKKFLLDAIAKYGEKIAVGVDCRDGKVAVSGWLETTAIEGIAFCLQLRDYGVKTVIYTDISRDGALSGANIDIYQQLSQITGLDIVASGGISSLAEIKQLREMGIAAAILGKSLYSGKLDLHDALAVARGEKEV